MPDMHSQPPADGTPPPSSANREGILFLIVVVALGLLGLSLPHGDAGETFRSKLAADPRLPYWIGGLYGLILLESLVGFFQARDKGTAWRRLLWVALVPPLRLGLSPRFPNQWVWIPIHGWQPVDEDSMEELEHKLAMPMIILTLLIIPVLLVEFVGQSWIEASPALATSTHTLTALIWLGFAVEFILLVSASPAKLAFCLRHWINLVIIILPLIAWLRFFRLLRFTRLARTYRLRSVFMRAWRLALLFELLDRLHRRKPDRYIASLNEKINALEEQLAHTRAKLARFERSLAVPTGPDAAPADGDQSSPVQPPG
jgi:hypothetical protein